MSLKIIKSGLLDTIQDTGRFGYQHLGINPGGAMDTYAATLANALLGKPLQSPVIEMHFPAAQILFTEPTILCLTGGDFSPSVDGVMLPMAQPVVVGAGSVLIFRQLKTGGRCYLSIIHDLELKTWLGSNSTNLKASAGGLHGGALKKDDVIIFKNKIAIKKLLKGAQIRLLPWGLHDRGKVNQPNIRVLRGNEWDILSTASKQLFSQERFEITPLSDRMGYRMAGPVLEVRENISMISSAVVFGTIQLLPDGHLIVLMADHQTIGGYPRVAHVITADLPILAQKKPGDTINFILVDHQEALELLCNQKKEITDIRSLCESKLKKILKC